MSKTVQNLVILDKSGSMQAIRGQAVAGVVETIKTIQSLQQKHPEIEQRITLVAFCSCSTISLLKNVPAMTVDTDAVNAYQPCCGTPLYDAVGSSCTEMAKLVGNNQETAVSVTIITDGYENASKTWTRPALHELIEQYKAQGWLFAYIGTDHDVTAVSHGLGIDNTMSFDKSEEGTRDMFAKECLSRSRWTSKLAGAFDPLACIDKYFDDDED